MTLSFTKHFVGGILDGLTYDETYRNATAHYILTVQQWEKTGKVVKPCVGSQCYTVSNVKVTES